MKKILFSFIMLMLLVGTAVAQTHLLEKLQRIKGVSDIKPMTVEPYGEYYEFWFEQPVDHENPAAGTFKQRVLLGHKSDKAPVILELQGYNIWTEKEGELSNLLKGNQITIEHRFFNNSVPATGVDWEHLTIKQAATDQHVIIQALKKEIYPDSKWVSTGISKGGQTTIFHRYFYPADVDISVPYVAPLNLEYVDPRIQKFLDKVGFNKGSAFFGNDDKPNCHWAIRDFQLHCFRNFDKLLPMVEKHAAEKGYTFTMVGDVKRALQLMILEYQFAFWQWGTSCADIPENDLASIEEVYDHLMRVSSPDFFEDKSILQQQPFFYGALTEMGMYDYEIKPFKKFLPDKENITFTFTMPKGVEQKPFDDKQMKSINKWLQTDADKMLFIYGGIDPWGATAVDLKTNSKCRKFVRGDMHHGCRIKHFEGATKEEIMQQLKDWLK